MRGLINKIILCSLATLILVACSDIQLFGPKGASIEITGNSSYTVATAGETITFDITSAKEWSVTSGQKWCKVTPSGGEKGNALIKIEVEPNDTYDERNSKITFKSDTVSKIITITQKQKDALLLTSNKLEVNDLENSVYIDVASNVNYTVEVEETAKSWISYSGTKAMSTKELIFNIGRNEGQKREGKIVFKSGELSETVTVYQSAAKPSIILTQDEYVVESSGEEIVIEVRSNVDYEMLIPNGVSWIKEVQSKAFSDYTHYISVLANNGYNSRETEIIFINEDEDIYETVKIVQLQKDAIIVAKNEYQLDAQETTLEFIVSTNVEFEVNTSVDWIEYLPETRALENIGLAFAVQANEGMANREGYITITSEKIEQKIKVIQSGNADYTTVTLKHTNLEFTAPQLFGEEVGGLIEWGDGNIDNYVMDVTHTYSQSKEYTMVMNVYGAEEIFFPNIVGIVEVDLSKF